MKDQITELAELLHTWSGATLGVVPLPEPTAKLGDTPIPQVDFDWDQLRLMVAIKLEKIPRRSKNDRGHEPLAKLLGVSHTAIGAFMRGHSVPTVTTTIRLMAWVGYTDFAEFLKDTP